MDILYNVALGVGTTAAVVGVGATIIGFGVGGIAAGSIAAGMQSSIGCVAAGSVFSTAQSLGAVGLFNTLSIGGGISAVTGFVGKFFKEE
jgi:hypothetical protein